MEQGEIEFGKWKEYRQVFFVCNCASCVTNEVDETGSGIQKVKTVDHGIVVAATGAHYGNLDKLRFFTNYFLAYGYKCRRDRKIK